MLKFWDVINCIFVHWMMKLTLAVNKNNSIRPYLDTNRLNDLRKKEEDKVFSPASIASKICSHDNSTRRMTMDLCIQGLLDNIWTWKLRNWRGWKSDQSAGFSYCSFLSFVLCQYLKENKSTKLYYFSSEWVLFENMTLVASVDDYLDDFWYVNLYVDSLSGDPLVSREMSNTECSWKT